MNQFNVSLWGDEAFSAILSTKSIPEIISTIIRDTSPPLYNITEHLWFNVFGTSEVAIRSLSFLYFVIAVFFVFKIGFFLWDKKTGAIAAALTFFNPFFFIYAFEGRMYSILAATVCASMYFFVSKKQVGYIITTTLALYSHHFAIFAIFVQFLWFLYEFLVGNRKTAITMLKSFFVVGLLYSPWIIPLYNQTKMVTGGFWLGKPDLTDLRNLIYKYLAQGINHKLAQPALYLVFAGFACRKWGKNIQKSLFLLTWFIIPILTTWIISQKITSIFFDRYLLYTIPASMLLLASSKRRVSIAIITLVLLTFLIIDTFYFTHPNKRPFRELASFVTQSQRDDDYLVNWNSSAHHLWESKYYDIPGPIFVPANTNLPYYVGTALMTESDIINRIPKEANNIKISRVGVITSGDVDEIFIPGFTKEEEKQFGELKFVWFDKR